VGVVPGQAEEPRLPRAAKFEALRRTASFGNVYNQTAVKRSPLLAVLMLVAVFLTAPGPTYARSSYTKAQRQAQKDLKKYNKEMAKAQKRQIKQQNKSVKKYNKEHPRRSVTG
jgi:hypothetical protein